MLISSSEMNSLINRFDFEYFSGRNILITGGSGLIGSYLTSSIVLATSMNKCKLPSITITTKTGSMRNLSQIKSFRNFQMIQIDLSKSRLSGNFDMIIHAASPASPLKGHSAADLLSINCNLFQNIDINFPNLKHLLFISAGEVYGSNLPIKVNEDFKPTNPLVGVRSGYPQAKIQGEILTRKLQAKSVSSHIVRLFHTFGPGLLETDGRSFSDFFWSIKRGFPPVLKSSGSQVRSFSYLEDSAIGIFKVLASNVHTPVNVGSSNSLTILQFAKKVSELGGFKGEVNFLPKDGLMNDSPIDWIVPDTSLLKSLGWSELVKTEEAISRTLDWIRKA